MILTILEKIQIRYNRLSGQSRNLTSFVMVAADKVVASFIVPIAFDMVVNKGDHVSEWVILKL